MEHFMRVLGRVEGQIIKGSGRKRKRHKKERNK